MNQEDKFKEMARRNDVARRLGLGYTMTKKAAKLPDIKELLYKVRSFDNFTRRDDPYGWHDLGRLIWRGQEVLWKIDYYDPTLHFFADPLSDDCKRIITVMLAEEY